VDGEPFAADSASGALIGVDMAETMGLKVGDEVVLVGQAYDGAVASDRVRVQGIFRTKIDELDGYIAVLPLDIVREFFAAPGSATAVAFRLKDRGSLAAIQAMLSTRLGERFEIAGWPTLLPMVAASVRYHEVIGMVVLAVFFAVVAAGVANPVLMAVLERTREFGIMLAIGITRRKLLALVLCEAILLGLVGLTVGNVLGIAITSTSRPCFLKMPASRATHGGAIEPESEVKMTRTLRGEADSAAIPSTAKDTAAAKNESATNAFNIFITPSRKNVPRWRLGFFPWRSRKYPCARGSSRRRAGTCRPSAGSRRRKVFCRLRSAR